MVDPRPTLIRLSAAHACVAFALTIGLGLVGPAGAQTAAVPKPSTAAGASPAPTAVNAPGSVVTDAPSAKPGTGPAPVAADAPRVGPVPTGQVAADDYRIGAQDLIEIQVFGIDNLKRDVRVNSRGAISLPLIGTVIVGGLTSQESEALIAARYEKDYLQDPQVSVFIKEFTSQRITLEGAVAKPGIYPIRGQTSLMQAIAIAGGRGQLSDLSEVMVFRVEGGVKKTYTFDLTKIRAGEAEDPSLVNEDIVVVKQSAGRVALRDSLFGDFINILNPLNYLPR
jgi:polysaccharide export outer membrane protein